MDTINIIINNAITYLNSLGILGGFFLILLESAFPILPLAIFIGMNILAFGNILGFIISYSASITGCMISFYLFKFCLRNLIFKILKESSKQKLLKLMEKMKNIDFKVLVILHALPFTPAFLTNIAAGLSNVDSKKYFLSLLIGKLSIIYFWGYIGSNILQSFTDPLVILKLIGLTLLAYFISKIVEKIIKIKE